MAGRPCARGRAACAVVNRPALRGRRDPVRGSQADGTARDPIVGNPDSSGFFPLGAEGGRYKSKRIDLSCLRRGNRPGRRVIDARRGVDQKKHHNCGIKPASHHKNTYGETRNVPHDRRTDHTQRL